MYIHLKEGKSVRYNGYYFNSYKKERRNDIKWIVRSKIGLLTAVHNSLKQIDDADLLLWDSASVLVTNWIDFSHY